MGSDEQIRHQETCDSCIARTIVIDELRAFIERQNTEPSQDTDETIILLKKLICDLESEQQECYNNSFCYDVDDYIYEGVN